MPCKTCWPPISNGSLKSPLISGNASDSCYTNTPKRFATKHNYELGVDPQTATVVSGERHAPVIYHEDPRLDSPLALQSRLSDHLTGLDTVIIQAWLAGSRHAVP